MRDIKRLINSNKLAIVVILLPIVSLLILILLRAVNVVYWDEWELTPIFQHIHSGHIYWGDFWKQHNEHRLVFPTIALVLLDQLTHWNVIVECLASFTVAVVSFWLLLRILKSTQKTFSKSILLLLLLLSLIWFSPVQADNWLWGWQLEWFFNVLGVMTVAFGLSRIKGTKLSNKFILLIIAGGIFAQFSLANGTLVWPIVLLALIYKRLPIKQILTVAVTGLITTYLYFYHYITPQGAPSKSLAIKHPLAYAKYVLFYLGRPIVYLRSPAIIAGLVLLIVFFSITLYLFIKEKSRFKIAVPWIFIGLYAVTSAFVTGLARLGFGIDEGGTSRYTTIALLLLVSTVVLCWQNQEVIKKIIPKHISKFVMGGVVLVLFACVISNVYWGVHAFNTDHRLYAYIKTCTHQPNPSNTCLLTAYPSAPLVKTRLDYLKSIHWAGY